LSTIRPCAQPFYLDTGARSLHCVFYKTVSAVEKGAVLYIPPFAEELNKSRRMVALQARALANVGWSVLLLDPSGCGDSAGDFSEASWDAWLEDIAEARRWLSNRCPGKLWLWGLRLGATLAGASIERDPDDQVSLLLWQPVISGKQHLQQFLRIKGAGERVANGREGAGTSSLLDELKAGSQIEVAGYDLPPLLALPMADASLLNGGTTRRVCWIEISSRPENGLSPASQRFFAASALPGLESKVVGGPAFWQTQEIEELPHLLDATTEIFSA
jgi:exosortase A-associated hydrolase 2